MTQAGQGALEALWTPNPWALLAALAFDRCAGELPAAVHPVVLMGRTARWLEQRVRAVGALGALLAGAAIAAFLPAAALAAAFALLWAAGDLGLALVLQSLLLTSTFAVRALLGTADGVRAPLAAGDLGAARAQLRSLCSRDPSQLDASQISAAAIESVAENASDSVVAPLFYYVLFGLAGAMAYRAVNTLDAMLGYRGRLEYLGKASARLDDLLNLVPARLTALCLLVAAHRPGRDRRRGLSTWRRDAGKTQSPNAGHPMAMMAGLLGVELSKPGSYRLGGGLPAPGAADIARAARVVSAGSWLAAGLALAAVALRFWVWR